MTDYQTPALLKRKIKEAVQAALLNKTPAQEKVFLSRSIPTQLQEDGTLILIYATGENISRFEEAPKSYRRVMNLRIECLDVGDDDNDLDHRLERIGEVVEKLMERDETLGGLVNQLELSGSDYQSDSEGANPAGLLALTYQIEFFTYPAPLEGELDDLTVSGVDWRIGHNASSPDEVTDAQDELNMTGE